MDELDYDLQLYEAEQEQEDDHSVGHIAGGQSIADMQIHQIMEKYAISYNIAKELWLEND
jgi:hypothetical protein